MIPSEEEQQTDNLQALGLSLAVGHEVVGDKAPKFPMYRQVAKMPLWLTEAKRYCQNPAVDAT